MPISHESVVYDIVDFKVYAMLTDSTAASPTYGAAVDVPGINAVSLDPNLVTSELHGDGRVMARRGRTDRFKVSATYSKIAVDVMVVMMGGIVSDITTPANETRWDLYGPASLPYFKAEFKIDDLDVGLGTVITVLYKCQVTSATFIDSQYNQFGQPKIAFEGIQADFATTPMGRVRILQNATNLSP